MTSAVSPKRRQADGELLRLIACFFVVLLHCAGTQSSGCLLLNAVSRFCVPVFVLLSGRFCLGQRRKLSWYGKKCGHLFLLLVLWSLVYALADGMRTGNWGTPQTFLKTVLLGPVHFWYLYAAIALYLAAPVLAVFCAFATKTELRYFLVLTFLVGTGMQIILMGGFCPLLEEIVGKMKVDPALGFLFLFVFGFYERKYGLSHPRLWYAAGAAGLAVTFFGSLFLCRGGEENLLLFSFFAPNVVLYSLAVYVGLFRLQQRHPLPERGQKLVVLLSEGCLGTYLLHVLVLNLLIDRLPWQAVPVLAGANVLRAVLAFGVTLGLVLLLRRAPVLRRVL